MSNNLDAPNIKYVKCMKWTLNRINYKTLYANLRTLSTYATFEIVGLAIALNPGLVVGVCNCACACV